MPHTRFSLFRLIICLFLSGNVAACSAIGGATDSPNLHGATPPSKIVVSVPESGTKAIILFAGWESERRVYEQLIAEFNRQNSDIEVQFAVLPDITNSGSIDIDSYYSIRASGGDTFLLGGRVTKDAAHYFRDLQPLLESDPTFDSDDFWPGALDACRDSDGRLMGIPIQIGFQGIFYDAKAFDAADLPYPQPGWTWDDFRRSVKVLGRLDGAIIRYGYAERSSSLISPLIASVIEENGGEIAPDALQSATGWYLDLVRTNAIYLKNDNEENQGRIGQRESEDWYSLFQTENRPAMWSGGFEESLSGNSSIGSAIDQYSFAPYPIDANAANDHTSPAWVECAGMSVGTQQPFQAWKWLDFLSRHWLNKNSGILSKSTLVPGRVSVTTESDYWKNLPDKLEPVVNFILDHAWYGSNYPEVTAAVNISLAKAAHGQEKLVEILEDIRTQILNTPSSMPDLTPIIVSTPKPKVAAGVTVINYLYDTGGEERQAIQSAVLAYNRDHPDIMVNVVTDYSTSTNANRLQEITGKFDCFTSTPFDWKTQNLDNLLGLNALMDAEESSFTQDFDKNLLNVYSYDGELYGLPSFSDLPVMAYNASILSKKGLSYPSIDWTFDDFVKIIIASSTTTATDQTYGFLLNRFDDLLFAGRGTIWADFNSIPPIPEFNSPGYISTLDWIKDLNKSGVFLVQQNDAEVRQALIDGKVAFWSTMLEEPSDWFLGEKPNFEIRIAPMPLMEGSKKLFNWSTKGHFISSNAASPQACWDWFIFLSEQPLIFNGIPARKSVVESAEWELKVGKENAKVYRLAISKALQGSQEQPLFDPVNWPLYLWHNQIMEILIQGDDYRRLLPGIQKKAEDYLACIFTVNHAKLSELELSREIERCTEQVDANTE